MIDLLLFDHIQPSDQDSVGDKALSLGLMAGAGLPVPPGFCLTTSTHRRLGTGNLGSDSALLGLIGSAYRDLGSGLVAVRSSATGEDGAVSSFAGQQETILGVEGEDALQQAIERCWASLSSDRAVAYRQRQGIRDDTLAMAVVVQRLVPAEVAGVLFTRDPLDASGRQMLVEASWGLGESVVSGRVSPDRYHLDRETGKVVDRHVAAKTLQRTPRGEEPVPVDKQTEPCLNESQLADLAALGRKVEAFYYEPRDIEWAFAEGQFWLLQARPITAGGVAEREEVRRVEISRLTALAAPDGTVWSKFNLAEILPAPTAMSWAVVRCFMSGAGGFGQMYRDLGYDPDPSLDEEGVFDLVCGRPYCNLSREPRLHYRQVPFEHSFAALKADPRRALYPSPTINPSGFPWWFWLGMPAVLPWLTWKMVRGGVQRQRLVKTFAPRFRDEIAPAFRRETAEAWKVDLSRADDPDVVRFFEYWVQRTLIDFARDSLKPTALAALSMASLEQKLAAVLGPALAGELTRDLVMFVKPDPDADLPGAVRALAAGEMERAEFLERFGHRGPEEMELSRPRWGEDPSSLQSQGLLPPTRHGDDRSPAERLGAEAKLNASQRSLLLAEVNTLHTYLALREKAKHYLMYGYALIRRALVELDGRLQLDGGIFYLTPEELPRLLIGEDLASTITERRRRRTLLLGMDVPSVLFSDDLEAISRPVAMDGAETMTGVPLSAGVAEAPALVLEHPHSGMAIPEGYVLVCPSTDPAWVPLFVRARALVMETGGVLSHGAIVAREFGLPAVGGLPGIMRRVRTGQRLRVDGGQGRVSIIE
jgi:phosphohistidine swiveling domain-containing protein